MRLKRHVPLLQSSLKQGVCLHPLPLTQCLRLRRHYSPTLTRYPKEIAILGGGISGLASAHFVSKEFPNSKITIFESSDKLGGWIKSSRINVPGGEIVFEHGPRTLRPSPTSALATLQLIQDLNLNSQVLYTSKNDAAALNRYIYYPNQLNQLPSPIQPPSIGHMVDLFRTGILDGAWKLLSEVWTPGRHDDVPDESVGDFVARRWDKRIADNLVSAGLHGIYAGDIYQLSARTLLERFWEFEKRYHSVLIGWQASADRTYLWHPYDWNHYQIFKKLMDVDPALLTTLKNQSTFYFKEGMEQLPQTIAKALQSNEQVEILTNTFVHEPHQAVGKGRQIEITSSSNSSSTTRSFDFVISSLPSKTLTPSVTTMVVNLWFKNPKLLPVRGFGYLIPRSVPFEQNPERALGVIFDHDATVGQDTVPGTKLTVMLGGHWWDGWPDYPDQEEGAAFARSVIQRHLGITEEPDEIRVTLNKECIPQYTVGYEQRAIEYHRHLQRTYQGRFRVVGSQINGVGVNDCITGAWQIAANMANRGWEDDKTGLERQDTRERWTYHEKPSLTRPLGQASGD